MSTKRKKKDDPNPLFKKWIREWKEEAERKGFKTKYVYAKALKSLEQFPLVLKSGKEAIILNSFGDKLCQMLDDKLADYKTSGGVIAPAGPVLTVDSDSNDSMPSTLTRTVSPKSSPSKNRKTAAKRKTKTEYVPSPRSGSYAILLAMHSAELELEQDYIRKGELITRAQPYSDTSFTMPNAGTHYTAWSSMRTLIKKDLVTKEGNPARFSLTEVGRELASKLSAAPLPSSSSALLSQMSSSQCSPGSSQASSILSSSQDSRSTVSVTNGDCVEKYTLDPGTFDILLCIDNCETNGGGNAVISRKQSLIPELQKNGVPFDVRKLHVGDFLWVARERVKPVPGQLRIQEPRELVLDFVVERKRMDDLASSIKDGRFHEQKFRLQNSGVRCPVYLVESFGKDGYRYGISPQALIQAVNNTQVINGFMVKKTDDMNDSVAYLTLMTRALNRLYSCRSLKSCSRAEIKESNCPSNAFLTFKEFNTSSMKNKVMTAKEMFIKQLLKLSGLSVDKALAITKIYETPSSLISAYEVCESEKQKEKLLSTLKYGQNQRNLGPRLSKVLYNFYMTEFTISE